MAADQPKTLGEQLIDAVNAAVKTEGFETNWRGQAELLYKVAREWESLTTDTRQALRAAITPRVQRINGTANPERAFDQLMELHKLDPSSARSDISKSIRSYFVKVPYTPDPEEGLYPTDGWIGRFIKYAKDTEVPVGFHFWAAVAILGAACKYKVFMDRGKFDLRMNWYVMLAGERSTGKSLSRELALDLVDRANKYVTGPAHLGPSSTHHHTIRIIGEDSTKESVIEDLKFHTTPVSRDDGRTQFVNVDSTGFMLIDELANFLGRQTFAVESKVPFLTAIYGSKIYRKNTKGGGVAELRNCALSMLACCAPGWLLESITPIMFTGGFLDRFRVIYRPEYHNERVYPTTYCSDPVLANLLAQELVGWMSLEREYEMITSPDSEEWYQNWYVRQRAKIRAVNDYKGLSLHRAANQLLKLAAILAISDRSAPHVTKDHMRAAARILEYEEAKFMELLSVINEDPQVGQLDYIIDKVLDSNGVISRLSLHNILRRRKGYMPFNKVGIRYIEELLDSKLLAQVVCEKKHYYVFTEAAVMKLEADGADYNKVVASRVTRQHFKTKLSASDQRRMEAGRVTLREGRVHQDE